MLWAWTGFKQVQSHGAKLDSNPCIIHLITEVCVNWHVHSFENHDSNIIFNVNPPNFSRLAVEITLTHWGQVTHICVGKLTIIASDNGLSPERRQTIIWTNAGILLIGPLGTNFSEILIEIQTFSFKKMHLKMSSAKWRPFCPGLNVLMSRIRGKFVQPR